MEHICIVIQTGLNEVGSIDLLPDMDDETRVGIGELSIQEIHGVGSDVPKTGRMIFQEGNVLKIVTGPVIIHFYKGLKN